jgi:phosphoglycolate phosphatase-like HAD superfamily hydrolase
MLCNLLILDIDGTLVDSVHVHREALRLSIESAPLLHRDTQWSNYAHRTDSGIHAEAYERSFNRLPTAQDCQAFERLFEQKYDEICAVTPEPVPGAVELLRRVEASGSWRVVFATGSFRRPALRKLDCLNCVDPKLVSASEYRSRIEIVSNAVSLGWSGLPLTERGIAVSIGDGVWDAQTALDLGVPFIGVARQNDAQALRRLGAFGVVPDCQDLWQVLTELLDRCEAV